MTEFRWVAGDWTAVVTFKETVDTWVAENISAIENKIMMINRFVQTLQGVESKIYTQNHVSITQLISQ